MISRFNLTALVLMIVGIWAFFLILAGISVTKEFFSPLSKVVGVVLLLLLVFDRWLWKLPFLQPWFVSTPDVSGTWKGKIISSYIDKKTGDAIGPIDAFLVIYQTFSSINIQMITEESKSDLLSGNFIINGRGPIKIAGIYNNIPYIMKREKSPIHYGGFLLEIHNGEKVTLEGEYWTDRDTKGNLIFDKRVKEISDSFDIALSNFQGMDV